MRPVEREECGAVGAWLRSEHSSIPQNPRKKSQVECYMRAVSALGNVVVENEDPWGSQTSQLSLIAKSQALQHLL